LDIAVESDHLVAFQEMRNTLPDQVNVLRALRDACEYRLAIMIFVDDSDW
jgi:hypothetical protein